MSITSPRMTADSPYYAYSIDDRLNGKDVEFFEFGHLFWRPLGLVAFRALQIVVSIFTEADQLNGILAALVGMNWAFGLLALFGMYQLARRLGSRPWAAGVSTCAFCVSFAFLNYAHTGTPYIPGMTCLVLALTIMAGASAASPGSAILAGTLLTGAVGFWATYVLVIPMALALPLIHFGPDRLRWRYVALVASTFGLLTGLSFSSAVLALGIRDLEGVRSWVGSAAHGIKIGGFSRMAFGIPRSFLSMGNDGRDFKRYLLHDPYALIGLADLIRVSLLKLCLFYVVFLATILGLAQDRSGRRMLALLGLSGLPMLAFAVMWQGGDVERYLPVYPLVFAAWGLVLGGSRPSRIVKPLVLAFFLVMAIANLSALSTHVADQRMKLIDARISDLLSTIGPSDSILCVNQADEVNQLRVELEFRSRSRLRLFSIVAVGYENSAEWRTAFANRVRETWARGGSVWISARAFCGTPKPDWGWVEGEDPRISWTDIPSYFSRFTTTRTLGGEDGFVLLSDSSENQALLDLAR